MDTTTAIVACCDTKMLPGACCSLLSAFRQLPGRNATFVLVVRDANGSDRAAIERFKQFHSMPLTSIYVTGDDMHPEIRSFGAYALRLQLDGFLGDRFERVLYLDSDTIAIADLGPLFDLDFKGNLIAAISGVEL
jgi:lipopolysaccharide biosynthesis glycosyltransferase